MLSWSINLTIIFACIFTLIVLLFTLRQPPVAAAMKKFINKAKAKFDEATQQVPQHDGPSDQKFQGHPKDNAHCQAPTPADVTRYRYHHGVNLGSVFVLERWLTGSMFDESFQGSSELVAAEGWVKKEGMDKARCRFEKHWGEYISDSDLDWLRDVAKCTSVRVPIGYFTLGPPYCENTPFKSVAPIYQNAWQAVKDLVKRCNQRGIGTLLDLHGVPGGANGGDHSGTNSGKAEFWTSRKHRSLATRCICFIAQQAKCTEGVLGIQLVNESEHNAAGMYAWYDDVLKEMSHIDCSMPIYISDAWDLTQASDWLQLKNSMWPVDRNPVVIDTHLYWCFTDADQKKSPQQITSEVWSKLHENEIKDGNVGDRRATQAVVGEFSCVLGDASWALSGGDAKDDLVRKFGNAQSRRYQQRAGGSFFWTYRMDWMPGGEWGFRQMTEAKAIVPPTSLTLQRGDIEHRVRNAQAQRDGRRGNSWGSHCSYWDGTHPGEYEHWRFEQGWNFGFDDAMTFFTMRSLHNQPGADKIGMLDLWVLKRLKDSGQSGKFVWEFETGMRQGVRDFYEIAGV